MMKGLSYHRLFSIARVLVILIAIFSIGKKALRPEDEAVDSVREVYVNGEIPKTIYLGRYEEQDAIYFDGEMMLLDKTGRTPFNFQRLVSPKPIFSSDKRLAHLGLFIVDNSRKYLYATLIFGEGPTDDKYQSRIVRIALDASGYETLCSDNGIYDPLCGSVEKLYENQFLSFTTLHEGDCFNCDSPGLPDVVSLLNVENKRVVILGSVGDVSVNKSAGIVSFREMGEFKEKCDYGPQCWSDGMQRTYKPFGPYISKILP